MNTRKVRRGNNAGMAQLTAVIFIAVAALIIVAVATRQLDQFNLVQRHEEYQICFDGVESARLHSVAILENGAAAALPAPTGSSAKSGGSEIGASSTKGAVGGRRQHGQCRSGDVGARLRLEQPGRASAV